MKKVLSMVAALLLCVGTQAQIVSSRSAIVKTEKQASSTPQAKRILTIAKPCFK